MKKKLLVAALALIITQAPAQTPAREARFGQFLPAGSPTPADEAPAQRDETVRRPGKMTRHDWYEPLQWVKAAAITETYTYTPTGRLAQATAADSTTGRLTDRASYGYNAAGYVTSQTAEAWDAGSWQNTVRVITTYSPGAKAYNYNERTTQDWVAGAWQNDSRRLYTYDAYENRTSSLVQSWENGAWETTSETRTAYTYTAGGQCTQKVTEQLEVSTTTYRPTERYTYTYASPTSTQVATSTRQVWQNGAWLNQLQVVFNYDAQQSQKQWAEYRWTGTAWQPLQRYTNTTGSTPYSFQEVYEVWQATAWVVAVRFTVLTDAIGRTLYDTEESWRNGGWVLNGGYRYLRSFNALGDEVREVQQEYDQNTQSYVNQSQWTYGDFQSITLGTKPMATLAAQTTLYPNPTTGRATVALPAGAGPGPIQAEVVNSVGQVVQRLTLQPQASTRRAEVNLCSLPAGMYSVRLHMAAGLVVKKVVRQ